MMRKNIWNERRHRGADRGGSRVWEKKKNRGVESEIKLWIKSTAAGWKEDGQKADRWLDVKSEWKGRQKSGGGRGVAQIRMLRWQNFECCHKTPLHYIAVCVWVCLKVCTQVIISLCQQHESKMCACVSTLTVLGVCEEQGHWRLFSHESSGYKHTWPKVCGHASTHIVHLVWGSFSMMGKTLMPQHTMMYNNIQYNNVRS